jgi:hypothetical protein
MNGFITISTKINAKEVIYTSTCVVRNNGVNVTANKIAEGVSPTVSTLKNAQLLSTVNPVSATGKVIRLVQSPLM